MSVPAIVSIAAGSAMLIAWLIGTFYIWDSGLKEGFMSGRTRIEYYHAPWCKECEDFNRRVWVPAVEHARAARIPVEMVRIEADQFSPPGGPDNRWKIDGGSLNNPYAAVSAYPHVVALKQGSHAYVYQGAFDAREFFDWVALNA